jgi:transcriptional regulator with GAF, ATPase, and Fis domain
MKTTNELNQSQKPICSPSGHFAEIIEELEFIAEERDSSVLFKGKTGVGKEELANYLVRHSERKDPYKKINCVGLTETTFGSELFGHIKGSFTEAYRNKRGLIEICNK